MLGLLFITIYTAAALGTWARFERRLESESAEFFTKMGFWSAVAHSTYVSWCILLWPLYWSAKLLEAPAQLLLPGPSEPAVIATDPQHFNCAATHCIEGTNDCPVALAQTRERD